MHGGRFVRDQPHSSDLTVSKVLTADGNNNGIADPGELLTYTVRVTTTGSDTTATGEAVLTNMPKAGTSLILSETMANGGAVGDKYTTSYACTNTLANGQAPSGNSISFSITPVGGDDITCVFRNVARPGADLEIVKTADRAFVPDLR